MIYVHKRTGDKYVKFYEGLMKHPSSREWLECVVYVPRSDPTDKRVRLKKEFDQKFRILGIGDETPKSHD